MMIPITGAVVDGQTNKGAIRREIHVLRNVVTRTAPVACTSLFPGQIATALHHTIASPTNTYASTYQFETPKTPHLSRRVTEKLTLTVTVDADTHTCTA